MWICGDPGAPREPFVDCFRDDEIRWSRQFPVDTFLSTFLLADVSSRIFHADGASIDSAATKIQVWTNARRLFRLFFAQRASARLVNHWQVMLQVNKSQPGRRCNKLPFGPPISWWRINTRHLAPDKRWLSRTKRFGERPAQNRKLGPPKRCSCICSVSPIDGYIFDSSSPTCRLAKNGHGPLPAATSATHGRQENCCFFLF